MLEMKVQTDHIPTEQLMQGGKGYKKILMELKQKRLNRKGFFPADKKMAQNNFLANNISDDYNRPLSLCGSSTSYFSKYGESLRIYFSFMEQLIWVGSAIVLLALILVNINIEGGFYNGTRNYKSSKNRE